MVFRLRSPFIAQDLTYNIKILSLSLEKIYSSVLFDRYVMLIMDSLAKKQSV